MSSIRKKFRPSCVVETGVIRWTANGMCSLGIPESVMLASLPDSDTLDVAFVDLENDPVGVERGDFEQRLALLHRGASS